MPSAQSPMASHLTYLRDGQDGILTQAGYALQSNLFETPSSLKRVASDNRSACGSDRAGQMDTLGIEHS